MAFLKTRHLIEHTSRTNYSSDVHFHSKNLSFLTSFRPLQFFFKLTRSFYNLNLIQNTAKYPIKNIWISNTEVDKKQSLLGSFGNLVLNTYLLVILKLNLLVSLTDERLPQASFTLAIWWSISTGRYCHGGISKQSPPSNLKWTLRSCENINFKLLSAFNH